MNVVAAQSDLRDGYMSGAPGVLASALSWFAAAFTAWQVSPEQSIWVLFVGGMLIYPAGLVIAKALGARGDTDKGNPLTPLAIATTLWLIFSLPIVFGVSLYRIEFFFPAMLLVIGGRYLTFGALYGMRAFWVLGLTLAGAGFLLAWFNAPTAIAALTGAAIELVFALALFVIHTRWRKLQETQHVAVT
jgi:hypothetical protein